MYPAERATGTRDELYDLISVLYHALHGAENCELYTADAETAGNENLAAFFREAQAMHAALAEQAKGHLGIGGTTPGDITTEGIVADATDESNAIRSGGSVPGGIPRGSADALREERLVADIAAEPADVPPSAPPSTVPLPDEDLLAETGDVAPDVPAEGEGASTPTDAPGRRVPPDAPRTQEPPPRTGDAPPSPSEQPPR